MENFSRFFSYIALALVIVASIVVFLLRFDSVSESYVTDMTNKFANECQTTGKIDPTNYREYYKNVYSLGNYEIEIGHRSIKSYPGQIEVSPGNFVFDGTYYNDYYEYNHQAIMDEMYASSGTKELPYLMKKGDVMTILVTRHISNGEKILRFLTGSGFSDILVTKYSGTIGYTGFAN